MEDLTQVKINMAELQKDIKYIKESLDSHIAKEQETIDRLETTFANFIKDAKDTFASKLTEKIVYGLVAVMLIGVVTALVKLVIVQQPTITAAEVQKIVNDGIENNNKKLLINPEELK